MGCDGNSVYFSGGVHTLSYQRNPSHPIPAQRVRELAMRLVTETSIALVINTKCRRCTTLRHSSSQQQNSLSAAGGSGEGAPAVEIT